jgi:hypothetical protein
MAVDSIVQRLDTPKNSRNKNLGSRTSEGQIPSHPLIAVDTWHKIPRYEDLVLWRN